MKRILCFTVIVFCFCLNVSAQKRSVTVQAQNATICSLVSEGEGGNVAKDAPLILYMYDSAQNRKVEIVFLKTMRDKMSYNPYDKLVNQTVCITGNVSRYNNVPAIIIRNENQIKTKSGQQVNRMSANH